MDGSKIYLVQSKISFQQPFDFTYKIPQFDILWDHWPIKSGLKWSMKKYGLLMKGRGN
jgi:hypothetical protein